jgi:hypothetical protein
MNRIVKRAIILYVFVASIALMAALPGVLGAPQAAPVGQAASDTSVLSESSLETFAIDQNALEDADVSQTGTEASPEAEITPDGWEVIVPGIEYREFHLPDPNNIYVARMLRSNQEVILESSIAQGKLASGYESVSGMAQRYEETVTYWDKHWGNRNNVVVAINGDYPGVEIKDGQTLIYPWPQRGQFQSSWYSKRFPNANDIVTGTGFVWKSDAQRSAFISECVRHPADKQFITFLKSNNIQLFQGINVPRSSDQLIIYTPQYDSDTNTSDDSNSVEALVQLSRPTTSLNATEMVTGTVVEIRKNLGSAAIPFDHVVLSASGSARDLLLVTNELNQGDVIGITQKVTNCDSSLTYEWREIYAGIGGDFYFIRDGQIQSYSDKAGAAARHPRTAIAYNENYIYFIVVDGRDPYASVGMTIAELGKFAKDTLGATYAIAEDGGGSSTMVVNGEVKNNTFCNNFYKAFKPNEWPGGCVKMFLPVTVREAGQLSEVTGQPLSGEPQPVHRLSVVDAEMGGIVELEVNAGIVERAVVNGLLMVVMEPITRTTTFNLGDIVTTFAATDVRLGPGTNYGKLGTVNAGVQGSIIDHANGLNGVLATGHNWWKVQFGGLAGWVTEQSLTPPSQSNLIDQKPGIYH